MPVNKVYDLAFSLIGKHLSLDETVPMNFGCAEAVSYILFKLNEPIPNKGIASTNALDAWFGKHCTEVSVPVVGDFIISITQGENHGHTGVIGKNAIISNDSQTGLWQPYWSLKAWMEFYRFQKGLVTKFYRLS